MTEDETLHWFDGPLIFVRRVGDEVWYCHATDLVDGGCEFATTRTTEEEVAELKAGRKDLRSMLTARPVRRLVEHWGEGRHEWPESEWVPPDDCIPQAGVYLNPLRDTM